MTSSTGTPNHARPGEAAPSAAGARARRGAGRRPATAGTEEPAFTVVLPVWHAGEMLRDALRSLVEVELPADGIEALVVGAPGDAASRSTAESIAPAAPFAIRYLECPSRRRSIMLNRACVEARGRVLVFADDDCVFPARWLSNLQNALEGSPSAGVMGGVDEVVSDGEPFGLALDYVLRSFVGTGGLRRGEGPRTGVYYPRLWNMAVPRAVAVQVALPPGKDGALRVFDETLQVYEEVELAQRIGRAGFAIGFSPGLVVGHRRDTTYPRFLKRALQKAWASRRIGAHRLEHSVLGLLAGGGLALTIAARFSPAARLALLGASGGYGALLALSGTHAVIETGKPTVLFMVPGLLLTLHLSHAVGWVLPFHLLFRRVK